MAKREDKEQAIQDMIDSMPLPGALVRLYTSKDRKSYAEGVVTDFIDNPAGDLSQEPEIKVWFTSRIVRGKPKEISEKDQKDWLPMSALEVIEPAS